MTKAQEKRLRTLVAKAEEHLRDAAASLEALAPPEAPGGAGPMKSRATRHSRDLAQRIDRARLAMARARDLLGPAE